MLHYQHYTVEELALDASFRHWVNHPTPEQERAWEMWLTEFPDKRKAVEQARLIVLSLHPVDSVEMEDTEIQQQIDAILAKTYERAASPEKTRHPIQHKKISNVMLKTAASVLLVLSAGWWYWQNSPTADPPALTQQTLPAPTESQESEVVNPGSEPLLVSLPDKSTVLLQPNGRLYYSKEFNEKIREVHLEGDAFFEVAKNPQKPFYVYTDAVVTKVLGTSFHIKANPSDSKISVVVKTGKVSIFTTSDFTTSEAQKVKEPASPKLVLSPNQQITYQRSNKQLIQSVVKPVEVKALSLPSNHFVFHQTPVTQVLSQLEENYKININYSPAQLKNCDLTASFTDEPLAVKLDLICGAIGVNYAIEGNQVRIEGVGCTP